MLLKFGVIGILTAALYAALLFFAVEFALLQPVAGAAVAYVLAVTFNYYAHYYWTYGSDQSHRSTGSRYVVVTATVFVINLAATGLLPGWLGVSYWFAQLLLGILMAAMTFVSLSYWVFSSSRKPSGA
ncbi:MAG: GtrA family protein [Alphaproteobacteria bacterium]|nr:GtrA family protein [Alphaproteobacteria bacterium]